MTHRAVHVVAPLPLVWLEQGIDPGGHSANRGRSRCRRITSRPLRARATVLPEAQPVPEIAPPVRFLESPAGWAGFRPLKRTLPAPPSFPSQTGHAMTSKQIRTDLSAHAAALRHQEARWASPARRAGSGRPDAGGGAAVFDPRPARVRPAAMRRPRCGRGGRPQPGRLGRADGRRGGNPFLPARVILQDFTGVPAVVDLAAMPLRCIAWGRPGADQPADPGRPGDRPLGADDRYGSMTRWRRTWPRIRAEHRALRIAPLVPEGLRQFPRDSAVGRDHPPGESQFLAKGVFLREDAAGSLRCPIHWSARTATRR